MAPPGGRADRIAGGSGGSSPRVSTPAAPEVLFAEAHARRRRRRRRQAVVVACLLVAGLLAAGLTGAWPGIGTWISGGPGGAGLAAGPAGSMPPYYVATITSIDGDRPIASMATVRDSATGVILDKVRLPAMTGLPNVSVPSISITAAGDDRTFLIAGIPVGAEGDLPAQFYWLRLSASGHAASLSRLPVSVPAGFMVVDMALSPDSRKLALTVAQHCRRAPCITKILVVTLATGAARAWSVRADLEQPQNLSWVGNDAVAFEWQEQFRLLRLAGPGGDLLASARIVSVVAKPAGFVPAALIARDGTAVIGSMTRKFRERDGRDTVVAQIVELSPRTGRLTRVLYTATERDLAPGSEEESYFEGNCHVLALAPAGFHALTDCYRFGRLDGATFTPLPGFTRGPRFQQGQLIWIPPYLAGGNGDW
jgi:hypothetical protein